MTAPAIPSIALTLVPNGAFPANHPLYPRMARASVVVTPSLVDNTTLRGSVFENWPAAAEELRRTISTTAKIICLVSDPTKNPPVQKTVKVEKIDLETQPTKKLLDLGATMWTMLMANADAADQKHERQTAAVASQNLEHWHLSHDIGALHYVHQQHRKARLAAELTHHTLGGKSGNVVSAVQKLNAQQALINIYLHPIRPGVTNYSDPGAATMDVLLSRRQTALDFCRSEVSPGNNAYSADFRKELEQRVTYALNLLQQGEEQLLDLGIYALQLSCVLSLNPLYPGDVEKAGHAVLDKAVGPQNAPPPGALTPDALDQAQRYVEFLLSARRSQHQTGNTEKDDSVSPPNFNQMLGLLHRFPGILRQLGLVFDIVFTPPANTICISFDPAALPTPAAQEKSYSHLKNVTINPIYTRCTMEMDQSGLIDFYATAQSNGVSLIYKRFLKLGATDSAGNPTFSLISQDAEGDTHKRVYSAIAESREAEYASKADALSETDTAHLEHSGLETLPSARTAGITLLHSERLDRLQAALTRAKAADLGQATNPLFADDMVLGYRVDVRCTDMSNRWYPLGVRNSKYQMIGANGKTNGTEWHPESEMEKLADEGFISPASTSSALAAGKKQLQIHQALFTWSGWGIGYSLPAFEPINKEQAGAMEPDAGNYHLRMKPIYTRKENLLPLRFYRKYDVRCRLVDIAGNSVRAERAEPEEKFYVLSHKMCRHEPVRSPQVLLTSKLNRKSFPGAQGDRLAVRDESGETARAVVPPREPLRMAELHGEIRSAQLPDSAFPGVTLEDNGSFPQADRQAQSAEGRDAIFTADNQASAPDLPYYPDPLAKYLRVNLAAYSFPASVNKQQLLNAIQQPLPFYPKGSWPFCWPCRISLKAGKLGSDVSAKVESVPLDDNVNTGKFVTGLAVTLPPAAMVTLNLSSAANDSDHTALAESLVHGLGVNPAFALASLAPIVPDPVEAQPMPHIVARYAVNQHEQERRLVAQREFQNAAAARVQPGPASGRAAVAGVMSQPLTSVPIIPSRFELVTAVRKSESQAPNIDFNVQKLADQLENYCDGPDSIHYSGNYPSRTPIHTVTLVHAVKKPLMDAAGFIEQEGTVVQTDSLIMMRPFGEPAARLQNGLGPDDIWFSAAKIACSAKWTDCIDNVKKAEPGPVTSSELVFEVSKAEYDELVKAQQAAKKANRQPPALVHHLRDTRAHKIIYRLSATSRFRDYYPDMPENEFTRESPEFNETWVDSSMRPPAPVLSYLIPSFKWREDSESECRGSLRQRVPALRVYHERPWLVSGDCEQLGIVLQPAAAAGGPDISEYVSRVAMDPVWQSDAASAPPVKLAADQIAGGTLVSSCYLSEINAAVDLSAFDLHYSPERQLWYCDIPFNICKQYFPFVRLALVRYQRHALSNGKQSGEARISPLVFADFAQIAPNRYVAVQVSGKSVTLTISGDAYCLRYGLEGKNCKFDNQIAIDLQTRWHHLGSDMGWRPTGKKIDPQMPTTVGGVCTWQYHFDLPHHPSLFKFRLLVEETETVYQDDPSSRVPTGTLRNVSELSKTTAGKRSVFFDFVDL